MKRHQALRKIDKKIYLVFIALIAIALINALFSTITIRRSQQITSDIVYNTNPSLNALSRMNLLVTRSRMLITNWVYLPHANEDKDELQHLNTQEYILLRGTLSGLMQHWKDTSQTRAMASIFHNYEMLAKHESSIMYLLYNFEDYKDPVRKFQAEDLLEREIIPRAQELTNELEKITENQTRTALLKQDAMLYRFNSLMVLILGFALLIICSVLFATVILSRSIIVPVLQVRDLIMEMRRGELPEMKMRIPDNAVGEMSKELGSMISGFRQTSHFVEEIGKGNFDIPYEPLSEKDVQGHALITMRNRLKEAADEEAKRIWMSEGLARLNETMRSSNEDFTQLLNRIIDIIVSHLQVQQAAIFLLNNDDRADMHIQLGAYYALNKRILNSKRYELKEGLVGQAVASNKVILLENQYDPYFTIDTGFSESENCNIMIIPLTTSGKVVGALEIACVNTLRPEQKELLQKMAEPIAASLFSVRANLITSQLLEESRKQAEELAHQEQELRKINNELTLQSDKLRISEDELKTQQEELKKMNIQLREKARLLEDQNIALEETRLSLSLKATQLEENNKYKSAFLANMSHELRTPLNSILILARLLSDNKNQHLSQREIEHAQVIHKSGSDLLTLINDILDLSKMEAGKVELINEDFSLNEFSAEMHLMFREVALDKNINFECVENDKEVLVYADQLRLAQVIKNLLSNAFKFTPEGGKVSMTYSYAPPDTEFTSDKLTSAEVVACICITDTGIGIAPDKQQLIFEAFQQADGSTSRKYGGTGLGLSITRELVSIMDGELKLTSKENEGSSFTVYLPASVPVQRGSAQEPLIESNASGLELNDDRSLIKKNDGSILIVDDDESFARLLLNQCHRYDIHAIIAHDANTGWQYAETYQPRCILLDLRLPGADGWSLLKKLKESQQCKNIPVHILSAADKMALGLKMGAESYIHKPVDQQSLDILFARILSNNKENRNFLYAGKTRTELLALKKHAHELDPEIQIDAETIHTNFEKYAGILIGSRTDSREKILVEKKAGNLNIPIVQIEDNPTECLTQLLNRNVVNITSTNLAPLVPQISKEHLANKVVLLADDDMRNIYSITHILEEAGMQVISAFNGRDALEKLEANDQVHIILMDIMMPDMNGIEAITAIRKQSQWNKIPVIAVTAKAMGGDREACMNAGASDYLTKPLQVDELLNVLNSWLKK